MAKICKVYIYYFAEKNGKCTLQIKTHLVGNCGFIRSECVFYHDDLHVYIVRVAI
jgi:hypothetical protein